MESPRILCPEVIGREADLESLAGWLRDVTAGFGRTVLIAGEAGVGKSALLRQLTARSRASGARFLVGECVEVEARRPFGPFVHILRTIDREFSAGTLLRLLRDTAPELSRLLPEVRGKGSNTAADDPSERYRVHESFVSLLKSLAARSPVVVVIEDLHWADEGTLELLPYLARGLRGERVMLVATYRSDEIERLPLVGAALAELDRGRLSEGIELRGLTADETARVIQGALRLARPSAAELVEVIHSRCEGNPFFIEEVLKALAERGDIVHVGGAWRVERSARETAIPESVRAAVEQRATRLSERARRALHVAGVIGRRFDFDLLRAVAAVPEEELLADLHAAIDAQLVVAEVDEDGEERYVFRHALTREVVLGAALQRERRLLHRAVGDALEARTKADPSRDAEDLAYHFDEAGDALRARQYHQVAGREAFRAFAFVRSLRHFERALELAPAEDSSLAELHLSIAEAAGLCMDLPRSAHAADEAARLFEQNGDLGRAGAAIAFATAAYWNSGQSAAAAERREHALRLLEPHGESAALAYVYAEFASRAGLEGRLDEQVAYAERAVAMARRTGALVAEVVGLRWLGLGLANRGEPAGLERSRECLALALKHELVRETQVAYLFLAAAVLAGGGTWTEVRPLIEERVRHARRFGHRSDQLMFEQGGLAISDGEWDVALGIASELHGPTMWSALAELDTAFIVTAREGPERGIPLSLAPTERLLAAGDAQWVTQAAASSCNLLILAGDMTAVLAQAERLVDLCARDYYNPGVSSGTICALTAARSLGDIDALRRWIDLGLTHIARSTGLYSQARRAAARAERCVLEGDVDMAIATLAESAGLEDPAGSQMAGSVAYWSLVPTTLMRLRRAELLLLRGASGDRDNAEAHLAYVVAFWRKAKASFYLGRLRAWADDHGLAFPASHVESAVSADAPAALARASRLTAREREVAQLVSQGLSNRDIAANLVISERTAEGHVEQVRNKLGFHSRSQIAAWVVENR